jgi:hypothetical protein
MYSLSFLPIIPSGLKRRNAKKTTNSRNVSAFKFNRHIVISSNLCRLEFRETYALYEAVQSFRGKHLASGCKDHLFHVLPADPEATTADTSDDLVFRVVLGATGKAQFAEMLNARHLVAGRTVILSDLRFNNDLWIELAGNDEVRRLIEALDSFSALGFAETDAYLGKNILNC